MKFKGEDGKTIKMLIQGKALVRSVMSISSKYVIVSPEPTVIALLDKTPRSEGFKLLAKIDVPFEVMSITANQLNPRSVQPPFISFVFFFFSPFQMFLFFFSLSFGQICLCDWTAKRLGLALG